MSINYWREIRYVDDGVYNFECLNCYNKWDARTSPRNWKLCPYCGTNWLGEYVYDDSKKPKNLYWNAFSYGKLNQNKNYFTWVIQEKKLFSNFEKDWDNTYWSYDSRKYDYKYVLESWKRIVAEEKAFQEEEKTNHLKCIELYGKDKKEPFHPLCISQYRLIVVKENIPNKVVLKYLPTRESYD